MFTASSPSVSRPPNSDGLAPPRSPGSSNEASSSSRPRVRPHLPAKDPTPTKRSRSNKNLLASVDPPQASQDPLLPAGPTQAEGSALVAEERERLREVARQLDERQAALDQLAQSLSSASGEGVVPLTVIKPIIVSLLVQIDELQRQEARRTTAVETYEIGTRTIEHSGGQLVEGWSGGSTFGRISQRLDQLNFENEERKKDRMRLSRERLAMVKRLAPTSSEVDDDLRALMIQEQTTKVRLAEIKKEVADAEREKAQLLQRRNSHLKELKRIAAEDQSRFSDHPLFENRFLLLSLCGRGGFSEVYRAYDLHEFNYVACKIHQTSSNWDQQKRGNFVKHASREYSLQLRLKHDRVVRLYNAFEIDSFTFCTVLEWCDGGDLDTYLKNNHHMGEQEAKSVMIQVFDGLLYLHNQAKPIIHYDLKPANILYHNGQVKITDFGLSKIMDSDASDMELTSQGAGTYWYLPPECFETAGVPKISTKVDVWSAGVVFYQLLFGVKPFGNDLSQRQIWTLSVISPAARVTFPDKPKVSDDAKNFISSCLSVSPQLRPDVAACLQHPYLGLSLSKSIISES